MITDVANKHVFDVFFYEKEASASPLTLTAFYLLTKQVNVYCPQNLTIFFCWVKVKGGQSANKFSKSQISKSADLNFCLDLRTFRNVAICLFAICGPHIFCNLRICEFRTQFFC
jgi:hypothetical protein